MKTIKRKAAVLRDLLLMPLVYLAARLLGKVRRTGLDRLPMCKSALLKVGVFPITKHYYEPLFDMRNLPQSLSQDRKLPGIDWNVEEQLEFLDNFTFAHELAHVPQHKVDEVSFYMENGAFGSGDAEYWYQLIRYKKPKLIIEIGSGFSTRMAVKALQKNKEDDEDYVCKHICVEPFEAPWLEKLEVTVIRQKVESLGTEMFKELGKDDILFIDSSHVIRPQGDVLFEYLELLPTLKKGVIVHLHDIFSPRDYLKEWMLDQVLFWNEQYLLEGFLTSNREWKIVGALNYLHHNHFLALKAKCPRLTPEREPGSFYIKKSN